MKSFQPQPGGKLPNEKKGAFCASISQGLIFVGKCAFNAMSGRVEFLLDNRQGDLGEDVKWKPGRCSSQITSSRDMILDCGLRRIDAK